MVRFYIERIKTHIVVPRYDTNVTNILFCLRLLNVLMADGIGAMSTLKPKGTLTDNTSRAPIVLE